MEKLDHFLDAHRVPAKLHRHPPNLPSLHSLTLSVIAILLMQSGPHGILKCLCTPIQLFCARQTRQISLTGAIERGIRKQQKVTDRKGDKPQEIAWRSKKDDIFSPPLRRWPRSSKLDESSARAIQECPTPAPDSIPYAKADSEFLYGTFAVKAALEARRRQLHTLYVYVPESSRDGLGSEVEHAAAKIEGLVIKRVSGGPWLHLLGKMCQGRPHNGFVLEASPLPISRLAGGLKISGNTTSTIPLSFSSFDFKEENAVSPKAPRFPFCLFLDQILDPGNLGAIFRSAYYFGVDRVILPEHNTAPLTGVAIKASAGAAEYLQISLVKDEVDFVRQSKALGWRFYGAVPAIVDRPHAHTNISQRSDSLVSSALSQHPTVLVLGSEAEGIRPRIARHLDETISIATAAPHPGIDSLNVSVAASILIRDFLLQNGHHQMKSGS